MTEKDREEERSKKRREAMDFARKIFKTFTGELQAHPVDIIFERDSNIRAEAKAEERRVAAERADEAIVNWADPLCTHDVDEDVAELRYKVGYAIRSSGSGPREREE